MKKMMTIVLSVLLVVLCLASCNSDNESKGYDKYTSLIADVTTDGYGADIDIGFWQGVYFEKDNMKDKTCVFNGVTYSGTYRDSQDEHGNSYITDFYYVENQGEIQGEFSIRSDTGELNFINLGSAEYYDTVIYMPDISNPEENATQLATEIISKYINIADYKRIDRDPIIYQQEIDGKTYGVTSYCTMYAKEINGCLSSDYIYVWVDSKGNFKAFKMGDIGAFDGVELDFDVAMITQSVTEKIQAVYAERNMSVSDLQMEDQKIMLSPHGDIGMLSTVSFDFTYPNGSCYGTAVHVFTILGRKE